MICQCPLSKSLRFLGYRGCQAEGTEMPVLIVLSHPNLAFLNIQPMQVEVELAICVKCSEDLRPQDILNDTIWNEIETRLRNKGLQLMPEREDVLLAFVGVEEAQVVKFSGISAIVENTTRAIL